MGASACCAWSSLRPAPIKCPRALVISAPRPRSHCAPTALDRTRRSAEPLLQTRSSTTAHCRGGP
eukprot:11876927-Alexandrium_andersonii.AAC.1